MIVVFDFHAVLDKMIHAKDQQEHSFNANCALGLFNQAQQILPGERITMVSQGILHVVNGDLGRAEIQYQGALSEDPHDVSALKLKALVLYRMGKYDEAIQAYQLILRRFSPTSAAIRVGIGIAAYQLDDLSLALDAFERAFDLDDSCFEASMGCAMIHLRLALEDRIRTNMHLEECKTWINKAINIDSSHPGVSALLSDLYFFSGNYEESRSTNRESHANLRHCDSDSFKSYITYQLARIEHVLGNWYDAAPLYEDICFKNDSPVSAELGIAKVHTYFGRKHEAIKILSQLLEKSPNSFSVLKLLGILLFTIDSKENAERVLLRCLKQKHSIPCLNLHAELLEKSNSQASLDGYLRLLDAYERKSLPYPYEILNNIGCLYFILGNYESARSYFDDALKSFSKELEANMSSPIYDASFHPTIMFNQALISEQFGDLMKSLETHSKIISQASGSSASIQSAKDVSILKSAVIQWLFNRKDDALETLDDALQSQPSHPGALDRISVF